MSSREHFPNIELASNELVGFVQKGGTLPHGLSEVAREQALDKRVIVRDMGPPSTHGHAAPELDATDWRSLNYSTASWLRAQYAHMEHTDPMREPFDDLATAGTLTIGAFLRVVPRVLARTHVATDDVNHASHTYAMRSRSFITDWSRVSNETDPSLAQSLDETFRSSGDRRGYIFDEQLSFAPELFAVDALKQQIKLDPQTYPTLRDYSGQHPSEVAPSVNETPIGCPALHIIPKLYEWMSTAASEQSLYKRTFDIERQAHDQN